MVNSSPLMTLFIEFLITHIHNVVDKAFTIAIPIYLAAAISMPAQETIMKDITSVATMNVKCLSYHSKNFSFVIVVFVMAAIPTANISDIASISEFTNRIKYTRITGVVIAMANEKITGPTKSQFFCLLFIYCFQHFLKI